LYGWLSVALSSRSGCAAAAAAGGGGGVAGLAQY